MLIINFDREEGARRLEGFTYSAFSYYAGRVELALKG